MNNKRFALLILSLIGALLFSNMATASLSYSLQAWMFGIASFGFMGIFCYYFWFFTVREDQ